MHFNGQRYVMLELIDPGHRRGAAVARGRQRASSSTRRSRADATPVVRYRSRDHAEVCADALRVRPHQPRIRCSRPHRRHADLQGDERRSDRPSATSSSTASPARIEPLLRSEGSREQVRFDDAIAVDVEALDRARRRAARRARGEIEAAVRAQLQVRVAVPCSTAASLPRGVYKNAIVAVPSAAAAQARSQPDEVSNTARSAPPPLVVAVRSLAEVGSPTSRASDLASPSRATRFAAARVRREPVEQIVSARRSRSRARSTRARGSRPRLGLTGIGGPHIAQALRDVGRVHRRRSHRASRSDRRRGSLVRQPPTARATGRSSSTRAAAVPAAARRPRTGCSTTSPPIRGPARRWSRPRGGAREGGFSRGRGRRR
jgi:hypothetical protein